MFVLVGTFALSTVQVCQLDVAYAVLFDMWAKRVRTSSWRRSRPGTRAWARGSWASLRGTAVFVLMAAVSHWSSG